MLKDVLDLEELVFKDGSLVNAESLKPVKATLIGKTKYLIRKSYKNFPEPLEIPDMADAYIFGKCKQIRKELPSVPGIESYYLEYRTEINFYRKT